MILTLENTLIYYPLDERESLWTRFRMREEERVFGELSKTVLDYNIFVIVTGQNPSNLSRYLRPILSTFGFEYIKPELGASYWVKEFEK